MMTNNKYSECVAFDSTTSCTININEYNPMSFTLDRLFDMNSNQKDIFDEVAKSAIEDVLRGINSTIFTYGQSGSGKTYTMYGNNIYNDELKGIIPRTVNQTFAYIEDESNSEIKFEIKFSVLEIYKENLHDLLNPETKHSELKIKEHPKNGIYVANLTEEYISSQDELLCLLDEAEDNRVVGETAMNKNSSRSHLLFKIIVTQHLVDESIKVGILNLVDLAGSEKISKTKAAGETLEEAKKINLSLSSLGNVISVLASGSHDFVPYRESKLTRILQESLGGNHKTTLIVTCSPHFYNCEETISTLKFAQRTKKIKNIVKVNIKPSPAALEQMVEDLKIKNYHVNQEINMLKMKLQNGSEEETPEKNLDHFILEENKHDISLLKMTVQEKDDEIENLKDEIENLKKENNKLEKSVKNFERQNNYEKILLEIEKIAKATMEDLKLFDDDIRLNKIQDLKAENCKLRDNFRILEIKYLNTLKEFAEKEFKSNVDREKGSDSNNMSGFDSFRAKENLKTLNFNINEKFSGISDNLKDENSIFDSYKNIFNESQMFSNYIIKEFLEKNNIKATSISDQLKESKIFRSIAIPIGNNGNLDNETVNLKNYYIKQSMLLVYYEKIFFDLLNRVSLDVKKFNIESKFQGDLQEKTKSVNKLLFMFIDVLGELKKMKAESDANPEKVKENGSTMSIRQFVQSNKSIDEEPLNEAPFFREMKIPLNNNIIRGVNRRTIKYNNLPINNLVKRFNSCIPTEENNSLIECSENNIDPENLIIDNLEKSMLKHSTIKPNAQTMSFLRGTIINKKNDKSESELRLLRTEYNLYKNLLHDLTQEENSFKEAQREFYEILTTFQSNHKIILQTEVDNLSTIFKIYQNLYEEEINLYRKGFEEYLKFTDELFDFNQEMIINAFNNYSKNISSNKTLTSRSNVKTTYSLQNE